MRVLVIGGGAIGQAFARHFQLGGATVGLLVRPRQLDESLAPLPLYPLNRRRSDRDTPVDLVADHVYSDQDEALAEDWDVVALAVSAVAISRGDWMERLTADSGDATVLAFANGPVMRGLVERHLPDERLLWGMLNVISYQAPLPHETLPKPGVAYWFPPGGIGISGPDLLRDPVVAMLKQGGLPAKVVADVHAEVAFASPILSRTVLTLELAGWSFAALAADPELLPLAVAAMNETWILAERTTGRSRGLLHRALSPFLLRRVLGLTRWVLPLNLERFFAFHYVKIADQSLMNVRHALTELQEAGIASPATAEIVRRLEALRTGADRGTGAAAAAA